MIAVLANSIFVASVDNQQSLVFVSVCRQAHLSGRSLHQDAQSHSTDGVAELIELGFDVNAKDNVSVLWISS